MNYEPLFRSFDLEETRQELFHPRCFLGTLYVLLREAPQRANI